MALRELLVELGMGLAQGDEAKLNSALGRVSKAASAVAAITATIGAGMKLMGVAREIGVLGDNVATMAERLGLGTTELQRLQHVADRADLSIDELRIGLLRIGDGVRQAEKGTGTAAEAWKEYGIQARDANGAIRSQTEILGDLAEAAQGIENPAERALFAMRAIGPEAGPKLLPLLNLGRKGIEQFTAEADEMGFVLGEDLVDAGMRYDDAQKTLNKSFQALKIAVGGALLPLLNEMTESFARTVQAVRPVVTAIMNRLAPAMERVYRITRVLSQATGTLVLAIAKLGPIFGTATFALTALAVAYAVAGKAALLSAGKAVAAWIVATGPALLMVALVLAIGAAFVLVAEDIYRWWIGDNSVIGAIGAEFWHLFEETGSVFDAMSEMIKVAVEFWAGRDGVFAQGIAFVLTLIEAIGIAFYAVGDGIGWVMSKAVDGVVASFKWLGEQYDTYVAPILEGLRRGAEWVGLARGGEARATSVPGRSVSNSTSQSNDINVQVDARGASNPSAVGSAVAGSLSGMMDSTNRRLINATGVSG